MISTSYSDADANNLPIGIQNKVQTGAASEGTFTITLRHEPAKPAEGVSDGDITNAGGETDVEVTLPISIQD